MNLFCAKGYHDKCKGISRGNSSDRETFICTCDCHTATNNEILATKNQPNNSFYSKDEKEN